MNYFIIDQINPYTGTFDEHKIVTGSNIKNSVDAALVYLSNYEPNWKGLGAISEATPHIFDLWLKHGNRKQPFSNSDFAEKPLHLSLVGDAAPDPSKSRHWITTETGSHILINGNGEVVAGAGGKLSGKKFSVPAGSKDVSKHIETVEKIAQAGYEKHGGDKAEYLRMGRNKGSSAYFAREYEKTGNIPEGHLKEALVDKPADNAAENGGQNNNLQANKESATLSSPSQNETNNKNEDSKMSESKKLQTKIDQLKQENNEIGQKMFSASSIEEIETLKKRSVEISKELSSAENQLKNAVLNEKIASSPKNTPEQNKQIETTSQPGIGKVLSKNGRPLKFVRSDAAYDAAIEAGFNLKDIEVIKARGGSSYFVKPKVETLVVKNEQIAQTKARKADEQKRQQEIDAKIQQKREKDIEQQRKFVEQEYEKVKTEVPKKQETTAKAKKPVGMATSYEESDDGTYWDAKRGIVVHG